MVSGETDAEDTVEFLEIKKELHMKVSSQMSH